MSDYSKPVLALDSTLGGCVAAIIKDDEAFARVIETEREQAAKLMPLVQDVLEEARIAFSDIGLIVTSVGPGSFTGLRIGLSTARSLGLALDIPVQGVSTFEAMARTAVPEKRPCIVVLETKRTDFYVQVFDENKNPVGEATCLEEDDLRKLMAGGNHIPCGDGLERLGAEGRMVRQLDPEILARLGLEAFLKNGGRADKPEPVYLRGADVSFSNKKQREINNLPSDS